MNNVSLADCQIQEQKGMFKVGDLNSLMELSESLAKMDQTVDGICKKLERISQENGNAEPVITTNQGESKPSLSFSGHL